MDLEITLCAYWVVASSVECGMVIGIMLSPFYVFRDYFFNSVLCLIKSCLEAS